MRQTSQGETTWEQRIAPWLAAAAFVTALVAALACRSSWSNDGRIVFFSYYHGSNQVGVASCEVATGATQTIIEFPNPAVLTNEIEHLLPFTYDGRSVYVLVFEKSSGSQQGPRANWLLKLDQRGKLIEKRTFPERMDILPYAPVMFDGDRYLWFTSDPSRVSRLNLKTLKVDAPFGDRRASLASSPDRRLFYMEEDRQNKIEIGRLEVFPRHKELLATFPANSNCKGLTATRERLSAVSSNAVQVLDRTGNRLVNLDFAAKFPGWEIGGIDFPVIKDRLWMIATQKTDGDEKKPKPLFLLEYAWGTGVLRTYELVTLSAETEASKLLATLQPSPNERLLAIILNLSPESLPAGRTDEQPDLVLVDLSKEPPVLKKFQAPK